MLTPADRLRNDAEGTLTGQIHGVLLVFTRRMLILCFFLTKATFASDCQEILAKDYRFPIELFTGGTSFMETIVFTPRMRRGLEGMRFDPRIDLDELRTQFPPVPHTTTKDFREMFERAIQMIPRFTDKKHLEDEQKPDYVSAYRKKNIKSSSFVMTSEKVRSFIQLPFFLDVLNTFEGLNRVSIVATVNHYLDLAAEAKSPSERAKFIERADSLYTRLTAELFEQWIVNQQPRAAIFTVLHDIDRPNISLNDRMIRARFLADTSDEDEVEYHVAMTYVRARHRQSVDDDREVPDAISTWIESFVDSKPVFQSTKKIMPSEIAFGQLVEILLTADLKGQDFERLYRDTFVPIHEKIPEDLRRPIEDLFLKLMDTNHPERLETWIRLQKSPGVGEFGRYFLGYLGEHYGYGREQALALALRYLNTHEVTATKVLEAVRYLSESERLSFLEDSLRLDRADLRQWNDDELRSFVVNGLWKKPLSLATLERFIAEDASLLDSHKFQAVMVRSLPLEQILRHMCRRSSMVELMLERLVNDPDIITKVSAAELDESFRDFMVLWLNSAKGDAQDLLFGMMAGFDSIIVQDFEALFRRWKSRRTPMLTLAMQKMAKKLHWTHLLRAVDDDVWDHDYVRTLLEVGEWFGLTAWQRISSVLAKCENLETSDRALVLQTVLDFISKHELWSQIAAHTEDPLIGETCTSLIYLSSEANTYRQDTRRVRALQARDKGRYFAAAIITKDEKRRSEPKPVANATPTSAITPLKYLELTIAKREFEKALEQMERNPHFRNQLSPDALREISAYLYRHHDFVEERFDDRDRQWFRSLSLQQLYTLLESSKRSHYRFALAALRFRLRIRQDRDQDIILYRLAELAQLHKTDTRRRILIARQITDILRQNAFQTSPSSFAALIDLFREDFQIDANDLTMLRWAQHATPPQSATILEILRSRIQSDARGIPLPRTLIHWQKLLGLLKDPSLAILHPMIREVLGPLDVTNFQVIWPRLLVTINHSGLRQITSLEALGEYIEQNAKEALARRSQLGEVDDDKYEDSLKQLFATEDRVGIASLMWNELQAGRIPFLVDGDVHCGYDVLSIDLEKQRFHLIEVKAKFDGYEKVAVSQNQARVAASTDQLVSYWPQYAVVQILTEPRAERWFDVNYFSGIDHDHPSIELNENEKLVIPRWYLEQFELPENRDLF